MGCVFSDVSLIGVRYRFSAAMYTFLGGLLLLVVGALRHSRSQVFLFLATLNWGVLGALVLSHRPGPFKGDVSVSIEWTAMVPRIVTRNWVSEDSWLHLPVAMNQRYGAVAPPNERGGQRGYGFDVTYTNDARGWRVMPAPECVEDLRDIVFVGCSFTYGATVEDDETFPYLLARFAWPQYRVHNYSFAGWGTTNAYLMVQDCLQQSPLPMCVFYGYIPAHSIRNYLRSQDSRGGSNRPFPWFELENGRASFKGMVPLSQANHPDSPALKQYEVELTISLIEQMNERCRKKDVPFIVLALDKTEGDIVLDRIRKRNDIKIIDLSPWTVDRQPYDGHPTASSHRLISAALAADSTIADDVKNPLLYRPGAIPIDRNRVFWRLSLNARANARGLLTFVGADGMKVHGIKANDAHDVQLVRERLPIEKGGRYVFRWRGRADTPLAVTATLSTAENGSPNLGLEQQVNLTVAWQSFEKEFTASGQTDGAYLSFFFGNAQGDIELEHVQLSDGAKEVQPKAFFLSR